MGRIPAYLPAEFLTLTLLLCMYKHVDKQLTFALDRQVDGFAGMGLQLQNFRRPVSTVQLTYLEFLHLARGVIGMFCWLVSSSLSICESFIYFVPQGLSGWPHIHYPGTILLPPLPKCWDYKSVTSCATPTSPPFKVKDPCSSGWPLTCSYDDPQFLIFLLSSPGCWYHRHIPLHLMFFPVYSILQSQTKTHLLILEGKAE